MRRLATLAASLTVLAAACGRALSVTYGADKQANTRVLNIVREYQVPVARGEKNVVNVPALMSFWGATNQQVVVSSDFTYSLKPDRTEIVAFAAGEPHRSFQLTWDSPDVDSITVTQRLAVNLACQTTLCTAARLPYPKEVAERFAPALGVSKDINPANPKLDAVAKAILARTAFAEEAVELACDWVNEGIQFQSGSPPASDTVLANGLGNCTGMGNLACALLRKMGIPAEDVSAKFIGSNGGHGFIEVYFPDAGWVFYDLSNSNRGFKSLDCLLAVGWSFRVKNSKQSKWHEGYFCRETDARAFKEVAPAGRVRLRAGPKGKNVVGAKVLRRLPPRQVRVRHQSVREIITDLSIPPGKREYVDKPVLRPARAGASQPATRPEPTAPAPAGPDEQQARARLKLAKVYLNSGMKKKAAGILRDILQKHPQTQAAKAAKTQLEALGEGAP